MPLSESDTRAKLIDPAIHARGWMEDLIHREETAARAASPQRIAGCIRVRLSKLRSR